jgi:hypothetical protein
MDAESLLAEVERGGALSDATVFRFRKGRALLIASLLGLIGLAIIAAGAALAPHVNPKAGNIRYGVAAVAGAMAVVAVWLSWRKLTEARHADTNLLVVARDGVVRRLCGRVQCWPFVDFPVVTLVLYNWHLNTPRKAVNIDLMSREIDASIVESNFYPGMVTVIYLSEAGATFQHELVDDGSFGPLHDIARALATRGTAWFRGRNDLTPRAG